MALSLQANAQNSANSDLQTIDQDLAKNDQYFKNKKTGVFGGQYRCPSGKVYNVADNNDECKSLAGKGGVILNCNKEKGKWSHQEVVCADPEINYELAKLDKYTSTAWWGGNEWGGEYKCPSGKIYYVSDKNNYCHSLDGSGGQMLSCNRKKGPWTGKTVTCAVRFMLDKHTKNRSKGKWGGDYRCPSGKVYEVGDNRDNCKTLAGKGGEMLNCFEHEGRWSYKQVVCDE